ncbi:MAG: DUF2232 domain-containing protein [Coprobacillus sp.]
MGQTNTKKMVQGAMIAAIFGALSIFNTYTGSMLDIFICYAMVIPLVWYGYHYSIKDNGIVCIVSMIVIALVGLPMFVISSFSSCLSGLFIGEALKRKAKKETILVGTFIVSFFNNILLYEVFAKLLDIDLISEMTTMYQEIIKVMPDIINTLTLDAWLSLLPIVLIVMSGLEMYVIILLCQMVLSRLKIEFPGSFHIATMHISYKTGIVLAIAMFGSYLLQRLAGLDYNILSYIYMLSMMTFAIQGLAFISFFLIMKRKPKWMILGFVGILIPMLNTLYVVLGILDIFSDLRGNLLYNGNNDN